MTCQSKAGVVEDLSEQAHCQASRRTHIVRGLAGASMMYVYNRLEKSDGKNKQLERASSREEKTA